MEMTAQDHVAQEKGSIPSISMKDFLAMQEKGETYTLIDVREQNEWDAGHIDEAVFLPSGILPFKIADVVPDKHAPIIVHCASGGRSSLCVQTLLKMGYAHVKNLEGGYTGYCAATKNK